MEWRLRTEMIFYNLFYIKYIIYYMEANEEKNVVISELLKK